MRKYGTHRKIIEFWEHQFKFFPRTFLEIFWAFSLAETIMLTCNSVIWLVNLEQFHERGPCTPLVQQSAQFLSNPLWPLVDIFVQKVSKTNINFSKVPRSKISKELGQFCHISLKSNCICSAVSLFFQIFCLLLLEIEICSSYFLDNFFSKAVIVKLRSNWALFCFTIHFNVESVV